MTFPTFPSLKGITWPAKKGPRWDTLKQDSVGGQRSRFSLWSSPRYNYELQFNFLRSDAVNAEWQTLVGFYNQVNGPTNIFQFTDQNDSSVTNQSFGTGDGTTTNFQLVRTLGGFTEPVYQQTGTPTIKVAGVTKSLGTDYNFSTTSPGVVVFVTAPAGGAALTWTGSFNWLCRFDDDILDLSQFAFNYWELRKVMLSTEKF